MTRAQSINEQYQAREDRGRHALECVGEGVAKLRDIGTRGVVN